MKRSAWPETVVNGEWNARYEQLRAGALSGAGGGWGLALLCRRGLVAWLRSWASEVEPISGPRAFVVEEQAERVALDPALRQPLICLLAGMILESERRVSA